jgi:nicotinamide riboside kinase
MKIAFTGSSSTGKTTLAKRLMGVASFSERVGDFITEDARSLLRSLGHSSMDNMHREELRVFQQLYYTQKADHEMNRTRFLVDRSFVDVAAYWLVRDAFDLPIVDQSEFENKCRTLALAYDLHIHFPIGQIPFTSDGYRSEDIDFHSRIAEMIEQVLAKWSVRFISITSSDLDSRVQQVLNAVETFDSPNR